MRPWILALCIGLTSCAYVSRNRYDELWDKDEDGWGVDEDCNDNNDAIHPFAPDVRGDGCDADCGEEPDADGDDWPDDADCAPDDASIFPCNPDETDGDGIDSDCDGQDGVRELDCNDASGFDAALGLDPDFPPATSATENETQAPLPASCMDDADGA